MKLNPPASSSDLEIARQIARRLNRHRRREDQAEEAPVQPRLTPPPLPRQSASAEPPEAPPMRAQAPSRPAPPSRPEPPAHTPPARRERPAPVEADRPEPTFEPIRPEATFDLPASLPFERPSWNEPDEASAPESAGLEALAVDEPVGAQESQLQPAGGLPDVDVDEPPLSPEELIGEAQEAQEEAQDEGSPLDGLTEPEPSPFDEGLLEAPPAAEEPTPPSWDDIVETCRQLAQARGAMLVDPAGQVFSWRGDWPAPGPEAIATKLVAMMAKTLKDAPTRSISAPLMGMHLTAWRIPLEEGLVTVAFIGAAPVRADARPAIDTEIHGGMSGVRS